MNLITAAHISILIMHEMFVRIDWISFAAIGKILYYHRLKIYSKYQKFSFIKLVLTIHWLSYSYKSFILHKCARSQVSRWDRNS